MHGVLNERNFDAAPAGSEGLHPLVHLPPIILHFLSEAHSNLARRLRLSSAQICPIVSRVSVFSKKTLGAYRRATLSLSSASRETLAKLLSVAAEAGASRKLPICKYGYLTYAQRQLGYSNICLHGVSLLLLPIHFLYFGEKYVAVR